MKAVSINKFMRMQKKTSVNSINIFCIITLLVLLIGGCDSKNWSRNKVNKSKIIGNKIIKAINAFKAKNGKYPDKLRDLPIHPERPPAGDGIWIYTLRKDKKEYELMLSSRYDPYDEGTNYWLTFNSSTNKWVIINSPIEY